MFLFVSFLVIRISFVSGNIPKIEVESPAAATLMGRS